jgi:hypothetical protein
MRKPSASAVGLALGLMSAPAWAQPQLAQERYSACQAAAAEADNRIVEVCALVDEIHARLATRNASHRRRVAQLNHALATALFVIGDRGDDLALADSIDVARAAAQFYDDRRTRVRWAGLQLQIAGALNQLARHGGAGRAQEAAEVARAAIAVVPRAQQPDLWAALHVARAHALMRLGEDGDRASLVEAAASLRSALEIYHRPSFAEDRRVIEQNLERVLRALGDANET